MKTKTLAGIMLALLMASVLNVAFTVTPIRADGGINKIPNKGDLRNADADKPTEANPEDFCPYQRKPEEENSTTRPTTEDKWNFNKTNEWADDFAEVDEDSAELVVGINNGKPDSYAEIVRLIAENGGELASTVSMGGEVVAVVAEIPFQASSSFVEELRTAGLSRYVEPNLKFQANLVPNDPEWWRQWGPVKIEADYAWDTTIGDPSVLVAVIDTGIDWDHPDLADNYIALGYDWVHMDPDSMDDNGHGTHCAGIIAAVLNNGIGIAGLAQISVMAEKGLDAGGWGTEDDLASAIIHAVDEGADILSNSWGGYGESELIHEAVIYAYEHDVLIVAAAGNEATSQKLYPAAYDEVIAVTATDQYDDPAGFTNFGEWVELGAPGVDIYSTVWNDGYAYMSGTSMATPHVAGVAALILSQFPNMTRDQMRLQLRFTADDLGDPSFDYYYGYGRVNARRAVEQAPPDHDLLILDWERPRFVELGGLAIVNTTVFNFGTCNETDITVQLLVNGSIVDSATIDFLETATSKTVTCWWTPTIEGTHNVTSYVLPVPGETLTENNMVTAMVRAGHFKYILFDQTHGTDSIIYYNIWVTALTERGYVVDVHTSGSVTPTVLADYMAFVIPQAHYVYSPDELSAIQDFVIAGGGLLVIGDDVSSVYTDLTSFAGIMWSPGGYGGETSDITPHPVTEGVITAYFGSPMSSLYVADPAQDLIRDSGGYIMLAASEIGSGKVLGIADENSIVDWEIGYADNFRLANNMIDWLTVRHEHDLAVTLEAPPYVEPGDSSLLHLTVCNRGLSNETDVELFLFINETIVKNVTIPELIIDSSYTMDYPWTPVGEGVLYNVTGYVVPVENETVIRDNLAWTYVYIGYPLKAFILDSAGTDVPGIISTWQILNTNWYVFGDQMILIDYSTLNKEDITYEDLADTDADVLIISCASDRWSGWEFTDSEIEAIGRYVHEGHGLIATSGTFYYMVPNNNKLAPLFGLNEAITWEISDTDLLHIEDPTHPLFTKVPNPYTFPRISTTIPSDRLWDSNELFGGEYVALGHFKESAIVVFRGLVYISPLLEYGIAPYYHFHLQLLYNAIAWSRYEKPEHELVAYVEAPSRLEPGEASLLNATVSNMGLNNETDVELFLLINGTAVNYKKIPKLLAGESCTISYSCTPTVKALYNVTAYAPPVPDEEFTLNNVYTKMVFVIEIFAKNVLVYTDDAYVYPPSSRYPIVALDNLGVNYTHYADDPWGFVAALTTQAWDLVIVSHNNYYAFGDNWEELEEYVLNGGRLVLSTFDVDGSDSEGTTLWETLGAQWSSDMYYPEPVYRWMPTHAIFTFPNTVGDLTSYIEGYGDDGDHVTATTGIPIGGFTTSPTTGYAAMVVGNGGMTVLMSFLVCEFRYDEDMDGKLDTVELWENAIAYTARPIEHELAVILDTPASLSPDDSTLINATVCNRGTSNETGVELFLLINGSAVNYKKIPKLLTGECCTLNCSWTPTVEGIYNVTAYAPSVPDEEFVLNNVKSVNVVVTSIVVALFKNVNPWDRLSNEEALSLYGVPFVVLSSSDFGTIDLSQFSKVVIASDQDQTFYNDMDAYRWWFEDYVWEGGLLEIHAADWGWHGGQWVGPLPGGLQWTSYYAEYVTIVDPSHPVVTTPNTIIDAELDNWHYSVHGYFSVCPADSHIIIVEDSNGYPAYLEFEYGAGCIVASSQTLEWAYWHQYSRILENSLLYAPPKYEHDVAIISVVPSANEVLVRDTVDISVVAENQGKPNETFNVTAYAFSSNSTRIYLEPSQYIFDPATNGTIGTRFNVTMKVADIPEDPSMAAWQVRMFFNDTIINVTRWYEPKWDPEYVFYGETTLAVPYPPDYVYDHWGPGNGSAQVAAALFPPPPTQDPFSGSGTLCIFEFNITLVPPEGETYSSELDIESGKTFYVEDPEAGEHWYDTYENGYYRIGPGAPPPPPPPPPPPVPQYIIGTQTVTDLAPGASITLTFSWNTTDVPPHNYIIWAEASVVPGETDTEDNTYTDGIVKIVKHPVANFTYSPPSPKAGETVTFNASASTPDGGTIISYDWDFGDGKIVTTTDPITTHIYASGGPYKVTLTITDSEGLTDSTWKMIYVLKRDIAVVDVTPSTDQTYAGDTVSINVTVKNKGEVTETFNVTAYAYSLNSTRIYLDPSQYIFDPATVSIGDKFYVTVRVDDVEDLAAWQVRVCYNDSIINVTRWYEPTDDPEYVFYDKGTMPAPFPPDVTYYHVGPGNAWAQVAAALFPPPPTVEPFSGSGTLCILEFEITAVPPRGETYSCDLNINNPDTFLLDLEAEYIPGVMKENGYYWLGSGVPPFPPLKYTIGTITVIDLAPGESITLTFTWDTTDVAPCRNYTITAYAVPVPGETSIADNRLSSPTRVKIKIIGDINGDGKVNIVDVYSVIRTFGSYVGHPTWNAETDLNCDGKVDIVDIYIVITHYGECG